MGRQFELKDVSVPRCICLMTVGQGQFKRKEGPEEQAYIRESH